MATYHSSRLLCWTVAIVIVFLAAPTLIVVPVSLTSSRFLGFPPPGLSLQWYEAYLTNPEWVDATFVSLKVGLATSFLATLLGTTAAFGLRYRLPGRVIVAGLLVSPMAVPVIVLAISYYFFYVPLNRMGITLTDSHLGLVLAHTTITIPYVVVTVSAALTRFDDTLVRAAKSLGASTQQAFWRVTFPILRPGIAVGALFAFLTSFDELVISIFLSGATVRTLPVRMWDGVRFEVEPTLAAIATLLLAVSIGVLGASQLLRRRAV